MSQRSSSPIPSPCRLSLKAPAPVTTRAWICIGLATITLAAFWQVIRCDFINYDDPIYVTANPHVQHGLTWSGVAWAFRAVVSCNWHPVTLLSHMLDCQIYGLNP